RSPPGSQITLRYFCENLGVYTETLWNSYAAFSPCHSRAFRTENSKRATAAGLLHKCRGEKFVGAGAHRQVSAVSVGMLFRGPPAPVRATAAAVFAPSRSGRCTRRMVDAAGIEPATP